METCNRSADAGLTTKSTAPARIAATTVSMPPWAVWDDDRDVALGFAELRQHRHAVDLGHDQVEDYEGDGLAIGAVQEIEGGGTAVDGDRLVAHALDRGGKQTPLDGVVVDDKNLRGHQRDVVPERHMWRR